MARKKKEEKPIEVEQAPLEVTGVAQEVDTQEEVEQAPLEEVYNLGGGLDKLNMSGFLLEDGFSITSEMKEDEKFMCLFNSALKTGLVCPL